MILYPKSREDSEEDYFYYNENDDDDAEELNEIIRQLQEEGVDLDALFDKNGK